MNFGERIKLFLEAVKMPQTKLAELCNVSHTNVNAYVRNKAFPPKYIFDALFTLGCSMDWLISGTGNMFNNTPAGKELLYKRSKGKVLLQDHDDSEFQIDGKALYDKLIKICVDVVSEITNENEKKDLSGIDLQPKRQ